MSRNRRGLLSSAALVGLIGTMVSSSASASAAVPLTPRDTTARHGIARARTAARGEQMRRDSLARARAMMGAGLYAGVGGGASLPLGEAKDDWKTGWAVFVPVGYDWPAWFGLRVDGSYEQWGGKTEGLTMYGAYKLLGLNGDLKVRWPLAQGNTPIQIYGLAGGNFDHLTYGESGGAYGSSSASRRAPTLATTPAAATVTAANAQQASGSESMNKFGWNAGAGLSVGWGATSFLVESPYFSVSAEGGTLKWYPVVAAITYSFR